MHQLIERMFLATFPHPALAARHDGAVLEVPGARLAFTTDSYVVQPRFFPGGDIGSLAVYGTVNDLAMCGARPLYLSLGLILEEGLPMEELWRVVQSIGQAAVRSGVEVVTGDTKVVERGKGDGIFINTAGVGSLRDGLDVNPSRIRPGDVLILSGDIGRHGAAVMAARGDVEFPDPIESDCAPLSGAILDLIGRGVVPHCLRDLTRGGLATSLVELARSSSTTVEVDEDSVLVDAPVRDACELFGLDPLYVANEGRFIAVFDPADADSALEVLRQRAETPRATVIGHVRRNAPENPDEADQEGIVIMRTRYGTERVIDMMSGEQLPRIC